jgi:secondary thiamine-phosphate synthase enzyme
VAVFFENHSFATTSPGDFIDLTDELFSMVRRAAVTNGMALVYSPHTTCSILINERESGFFEDLRRLMASLAPAGDAYYRHDDMAIRTENIDPDDAPNGHAHCRGSVFGATSQTIPIIDGKLMLGRWQRVFFLELDRARDRKVFIEILGE